MTRTVPQPNGENQKMQTRKQQEHKFRVGTLSIKAHLPARQYCGAMSHFTWLTRQVTHLNENVLTLMVLIVLSWENEKMKKEEIMGLPWGHSLLFLPQTGVTEKNHIHDMKKKFNKAVAGHNRYPRCDLLRLFPNWRTDRPPAGLAYTLKKITCSFIITSMNQKRHQSWPFSW